MSIQFLVSMLRDIEVDARKAYGLVKQINQYGGGEAQAEALEDYTRNTLVGVNAAERMAEQIKAEAEKEESK